MARVRVTVMLEVPDKILEGLTDDQKITEILNHEFNSEFEDYIEEWEFLYN